MTFSRPSIGPIDVGGRIRNPQDQRGTSGVDVPRAISGPAIDSTDRDVRRIAAQVESDNKRIGSILGGLGEIAGAAFGALEKTMDRNQWREILADPKISEKLKSADPETRKIINTFRPNVQEMAGTYTAGMAAERYQQQLIGRALTTTGLTEPGFKEDGTRETFDEWKQSKDLRLSRLRDEARRTSGLVNVDARFLPNVIEQIAKADGALTGTLVKRETELVASQQQAAFIEGATLKWRNAISNYLSIARRPAKTADERTKQAVDINALWTDLIIRHNHDSAAIGLPQIQANAILVNGVTALIMDIARPDSGLTKDEQNQMLRAISTMFTARTAGTGAVVSFGDLAVGQNGETGSQQVFQAIRAARAMMREDGNSEALKLIARLHRAYLSGDNANVLSITTQLFDGIESGAFQGAEEQINSSIMRISGAQAAGTPAQARFGNELQDRLALIPNAEDRKSLINQAQRSGRLAPGVTAELLNRYGSPTPDELKTPRSLAASIISAPREQNAVITYREKFLSQLVDSGRFGSDPTSAVKSYSDRIQLDLTKATVDFINNHRAANGGKDPDRATLEKFVVDKELSLQDKVLKDLNAKPRNTEDYNDRMGRMFGDYLTAVESGKGDVKRFTPEIIQEYRKTNPGARADFRSIEQWLIQGAQKVKGTKDGKEVQIYADPQLMIREAREKYRKSVYTPRPGPGSSGLPGPALSNPLLSMDPGTLTNTVGQMLVNLIPAGSAVAAPANVSSGPKLPEAVDLKARSMLKLVGISDQFIRGMANMAPAVVNAQNYSVLEGLRAGNPVTMNTPPVPQAAANVPQPMPAVITPNHPYMIAMGIGEGTRTASGAKTPSWTSHRDPANGKVNVGTISYQGGNGPKSPAAADAYYARLLQREYLRLTPALERLGLMRNTVGFNRVMYNALDLFVQAPDAYQGRGSFIEKLPEIVRKGATLEVIAYARANSYYDPDKKGRLIASPAFGQDMTTRFRNLLADQRKRAMTFEYKTRFN